MRFSRREKEASKRLLLAAILLLVFAIPVFGAHQSVSNHGPQVHDVQLLKALHSLRILSPTKGEKVGGSSVAVRYELMNRGATSLATPLYRLQLDGRDRVYTTFNEHTFTGLAPGNHTIVIALVDANHFTILGSRTIVHFQSYLPGAKSKPQTTGALTLAPVHKAKLPLAEMDKADRLPATAGDLPLLSMVGFGVLVGGVISAIRARR